MDTYIHSPIIVPYQFSHIFILRTARAATRITSWDIVPILVFGMSPHPVGRITFAAAINLVDSASSNHLAAVGTGGGDALAAPVGLAGRGWIESHARSLGEFLQHLGPTCQGQCSSGNGSINNAG